MNTSTSAKVQYSYSEMTSGTNTANHSRLLSMTYPNGRVLNYSYGTGGGLDDKTSRVGALTEGSGTNTITLEGYKYLGLGTIVEETHPQTGINLTYVKQGSEPVGDAGDQYAGLDRFGRVVDQRYLNTNSGTSLASTDRFGYGYDRASNALYKNNLGPGTSAASMSELYHASGTNGAYDNFNRLTAFSRGTLSASGSTLDTVSTPARTQAWGLDQLGNWDTITTNSSTQTASFNAQNQITGLPGQTTPTYDAAGDTTTDQAGDHFAYDAWNRLAGASDSGYATTLGAYDYDSLGRRVAQGPAAAVGVYFSDGWQAIEERGGGTTSQNVWSLSYVDDLVLRDRDGDSNPATGNLGASGSGLEERLYAQHDANHNVTSITDATGAVQERFVYDPYGARTVLSAPWVPQADAYGFLNGFQGGPLDPVTGLYHFAVGGQGRDLNPATGTWMQSDVAGYVDGMSLYQVEQGRPSSGTDPSGLHLCTKHGAQRLLDLTRILAPGADYKNIKGHCCFSVSEGGGLSTERVKTLSEPSSFIV